MRRVDINMKKNKKIIKDFSNEIFENDNKEDSHDIFANKDNLFIEDTTSTPKLEEENNIELSEINNILQSNITNIEKGNEEKQVNDVKKGDFKENNVSLNETKQEI